MLKIKYTNHKIHNILNAKLSSIISANLYNNLNDNEKKLYMIKGNSCYDFFTYTITLYDTKIITYVPKNYELIYFTKLNNAPLFSSKT